LDRDSLDPGILKSLDVLLKLQGFSHEAGVIVQQDAFDPVRGVQRVFHKVLEPTAVRIPARMSGVRKNRYEFEIIVAAIAFDFCLLNRQ
jgi:hypothetical protein